MTSAELAQRVLQAMGLQAAGESAQPEDVQLVGTKYGSLYRQLLALSLVAWAESEDVPEEFAEQIVMMVAALCVNEYEIIDARRNVLLQGGLLHLTPPSYAEKSLRKQLAVNYVSSPAETEYF
jgi:hypothetical protein